MRTHPTDPRLSLVEVSDFQQDPLPAPVRERFDALTTILHWAGDYLSSPHPELGRSGAVCPFTGPAIRREVFFMTVVPGVPALAEVEEIVRGYRDWFLEMEPKEGRLAAYKSINILFPDIPEPGWSTLIEAAQERLKAEYVPRGIMIGEFHPGPPPQAALWNSDFRPLKSPVPLLSIRHMVPTDWVFLRHRKDWASAYLEVHGGSIPAHLASDVAERAQAFGLILPPPALATRAAPPLRAGEALTSTGA
jgi:hypothetical protein